MKIVSESYHEFLSNLNEGLHDPSIFKAIFISGGPGSGKSYVVDRSMRGLGLKVVNSDNQFEHDLKKAGLKPTPEDIFSDEGQRIRNRSKELTQKSMENYLNGRLGLIIDGTGKDYTKIKNQADSLKELGYDVYMVFVNTSLETALSRNSTRDRQLDPGLVTHSWNEVQANLGKFQNYFDTDKFIIVDNDGKSGEDVFGKVWKRIMKFTKAPIQNYIAKKWIKDQMNR